MDQETVTGGNVAPCVHMSFTSLNSHLFLELSGGSGFLSATILCSIQPTKGVNVSEVSTMITAIPVPFAQKPEASNRQIEDP